MSWALSACRGWPPAAAGYATTKRCRTGRQDGPASVVVPIDKLSILVTVAFSYVVFRERLTKRSALGLVLIVGGTLLMLV